MAVGYYDDGIWMWISTYAPATVTLDDSSWQYYGSTNENVTSHIFVNLERVNGNHTINVTATQTGSVSSKLLQQTRSFNFDIEVDCFEISSWDLVVDECEFGTNRHYYEVEDVVIRETDRFIVNAHTSLSRYGGVRLNPIEIPDGAEITFTYRDHLTILGYYLEVGTHTISFDLDYGINPGDIIVFHGGTIHVEFNVTVLPDDEDVIITTPITDVMEGDNYSYAPETKVDERPCYLEWNNRVPVPEGMSIQRSVIEGSLVRESLIGTATESFLSSFTATMVHGQRVEYQNVIVNVHPQLSQNLVADTIINAGYWEATVLTTEAATIRFEGLPGSITKRTVDEYQSILAGVIDAGIYQFTIRAFSGYDFPQYSNATYGLTVLADLDFVSTPQLNGMVKQEWAYSPQLNDGNAIITMDNAPSWATFENGSISGTPSTPGEYIFEITGTRDYPFDQTVQIFTVIVGHDCLSPIAAFSMERNQLSVDFTDRSWDASTWHWDFGDGQNSTERNVCHAYVANGTYHVTLSVTNEHGNDALTKTVSVRIGGTDGDGGTSNEGVETPGDTDGDVSDFTDGDAAENAQDLRSIIFGVGINWAWLLLIPLAVCIIEYHRSGNRMMLIIALILTIVLVGCYYSIIT